ASSRVAAAVPDDPPDPPSAANSWRCAPDPAAGQGREGRLRFQCWARRTCAQRRQPAGKVQLSTWGPVKRAGPSSLFADAELAEDEAEEIFGIGAADDVADEFHGGAQIFGDEVERAVAVQALQGGLQGF